MSAISTNNGWESTVQHDLSTNISSVSTVRRGISTNIGWESTIQHDISTNTSQESTVRLTGVSL